jgi:nucleotide-binding universal stress UspA family protein
MFKLESILVPMDFSRDSEHALDYAIALAERVGAGIQLLHSYGAEMFSSIAYGPNHAPRIPPDFENQVKRAASEKLSGYREKVAARGIDVDTQLSHLVPASAIVETAERLGSDLIVMGTHGLTGLKHLLLGSVAERTIRTAPCPVLTVRLRENAG